MKPDPVVVQVLAEKIRAEVIARAPAIKLDPVLVQKIRQRVPIFSGMTPDCLMRTLAVAEYLPVKAGEVALVGNHLDASVLLADLVGQKPNI